MLTSLAPLASAHAEDGPLFRFSANVMPAAVVGGGVWDGAMFGGGTSIGLDYASIDVLDLGVRARLVVAPIFSEPGVWGGPGFTTTLAVAARVHTPLVVDRVSFGVELSVGPSIAGFAIRGDYGTGSHGVSILAQPGLEWVITPRFAMTAGIDLGVLVDVRGVRPDAVLQGALVIGMRAG